MTTRVGIRQLKNEAPQLVRRAAAGERIVILRHGKPEAVLGPAGLEGSADLPHTATWEAERHAFGRLLPRLERRYHGKYVALRRGRVVGSDADPERLFRRVERRHALGSFFIGRVGVPEPIADIPGFEVR